MQKNEVSTTPTGEKLYIEFIQSDAYLGQQQAALHVDTVKVKGEKKLKIGISRWNWQGDCDTSYITMSQENALKVLKCLQKEYS